ncbi:MAG: hypothetical protein ACYCQJ_09095 [Nitrososphaerales archaeon]
MAPQGKPNPSLRRLQKLVGTWEMKGRTFDSDRDNVGGRVNVEWFQAISSWYSAGKSRWPNSRSTVWR